ncbi:MAG: hypothetical protein IPN13_12235 [Bacteroidetes bacterium]|nr:hypothetical protein [Bacteroidota bacterium]MBK8874641.1 hypothetical protein [Bacteroidota bacterium]
MICLFFIFGDQPLRQPWSVTSKFKDIMTISKKKLTILVNLILATVSILISFWTGLLFFVPLLFALGLPLVNIDGPLKKKVGLTFVIVLTTTAIFLMTVLTAISFDFDKYIFPGLLSGFAGALILGINGLLIDNVKLNPKTLLSTFIIAGLSLPVWIFLTEQIFPDSIVKLELVRQFGMFHFWMVLMTLGFSFSIDEKPTGNNS